jgi:hypothetical protein
MMGRGSILDCDIPRGGAKPLPAGVAEIHEAHLVDLARSALAWEWWRGVAGIRDGVLTMRPLLIPWRRFEAPVGDVRRVVLYRAPGPMTPLRRLTATLLRRMALSAVCFGLLLAVVVLLGGKPWQEALPRAAVGGACIGLLCGGLPTLAHAWEFRRGISLFAFQIRAGGGPDRLTALSVKRQNEASALARLASVFEIERVPLRR